MGGRSSYAILTRRYCVLLVLTALPGACSNGTPVAPTPSTPAPAPSLPNRSPEIVATITPSIGIDQVTTFTARVEVKDPDGDPVMVTLTSICPFQKDTPVELNGGVGVVSIKPVEKCGPTLSFTATDRKGATARADVAAEHRGLTGSFRLVIGDGFYTEPRYSITLAQSGTLVTGTLSDYPRSGVMDLQTPGSIDENGRFQLRFRVQTDPEEFVLSGELIASNEISLGDRVMATGRVVSGRHAGRAFTIWVPAYALSPGSLAVSRVLQLIRCQGYPLALHQISPSDIGSVGVTYY